jgi:hypothetical protein
MSTSPAFGSLLGSRHILVKADTNLCGSLKDMEELPKREPEQRADDRYGVSE